MIARKAPSCCAAQVGLFVNDSWLGIPTITGPYRDESIRTRSRSLRWPLPAAPEAGQWPVGRSRLSSIALLVVYIARTHGHANKENSGRA